ncbi:HNH endonuclease signature motif containing protein [Microbispora catharanthi]|uniref:HNH endonuclease signature motif containing protein n=1 Tax=Microbispora catharanthi TaxID=1712871 RepID=UPI001F0D2B47|nr:HNH endonuclease signature motif containing protein [Microbispora catharanthi]
MESPLADPGRLGRSNIPDENWWERLTSRSPLWSSGSATYGGEHVRELFGEPSRDPRVTQRWNCLVEQIRLHSNATAGNRASATSHADAFTGAFTGADRAGASGAGAGGAGGGVGGAHGSGARGCGARGCGAGGCGAGGCGAGGCGAGAGRDKGRSSWVLVGSLRESAQALALAAVPEDVDVCLAEAEELLFARDRITCALADRVGRVHGAGQAKRHGHASTRSWLRTAGGMSVAGAGRLLTLAVELARLPRVREKFAEGGLAAGVVEAICAATAQLSDEHAGLAESILLELAGQAGAAEVAKAGRYLRAVLDPDGEDRDERADFGRRFLRVRPTRGGGVEGEFYLPREAAARLRALLDAYAKPRAEGDDRPLRVRQADAFIALLEQKVAAELLVLVTAESLPTDPEPADPEPAAPGPDHPGPDHPEDIDDAQDAEDAEDAQNAEDTEGAEADEDGRDREGTSATGDIGSADDPGDVEDAGGSALGEMGGPCDVGSIGAAAPAQDEGLCHPADPADPADCGDCGDCGDAGADAGSPSQAARPDPPPGDAAAHHAHAGHRPAGDCRHVQGTCEDHGHEHRRHGEGGCGCGGDARCSCAPGTPGSEWGVPGRPPGTAPGTAPGTLPGALLGAAPGVLLATGQMLPVSSVHRLARTSSLVRLVMDAEGQVLDMGRKVRLATPAQRRAVFARYATCWIDGCPLPATMCQIDHADNWSNGGLTDLKLLGPACQFHNRDRYRHPDRYTRRKIGTDRWAFTYHPAHIRVRSPRHEPGT